MDGLNTRKGSMAQAVDSQLRHSVIQEQVSDKPPPHHYRPARILDSPTQETRLLSFLMHKVFP